MRCGTVDFYIPRRHSVQATSKTSPLRDVPYLLELIPPWPADGIYQHTRGFTTSVGEKGARGASWCTHVVWPLVPTGDQLVKCISRGAQSTREVQSWRHLEGTPKAPT